MKTPKFFLLKTNLVLCLLGILFYTCTKDKTPMPPEPCDPNKVYFQNQILPLVTANCAKSGCHDEASAAEGYVLTTYKGIMELVKPGNPSKSKIMEVVNETNPDKVMPRPPENPLTQEQKNLISNWISEGALNNYCTNDTANCNSSNVSYANDITKILSNCQACHSGNTIKGNVDLSNYTGVQSAAASGKLYNAVAQNGAAQPMPPSPSPKLSSCDIKKIKSWVDAGAKNN